MKSRTETILPLFDYFQEGSAVFVDKDAMEEPDLQAIHDFLFDLALKAGDMITSANPSTIDTKKNCKPLQDHT